MISRSLPLLASAAAILATTGCASTKSRAERDAFDRLELTMEKSKSPPEFGEGLEGRLVDGKRVYTVMMMLSLTKEGKVTDVEMVRTDAPQRLQWAAMQAMRKTQFPPMKQPGTYVQIIKFNGLKVDRG
ncbi:energy transducer TonB [Luteolibacter flavescens]|uniref:Energy transducer TonB n=1 Tax=Luteolibacter flavescens TaxID=1859460 RepID=A0ABT3FPQ8_9BACT|nr:energy transducer TonB [Luteolibacter flavescens]MCW1885299.1 energy transducer TonB [Luteolibacter flavescens]